MYKPKPMAICLLGIVASHKSGFLARRPATQNTLGIACGRLLTPLLRASGKRVLRMWNLVLEVLFCARPPQGLHICTELTKRGHKVNVLTADYAVPPHAMSSDYMEITSPFSSVGTGGPQN